MRRRRLQLLLRRPCTFSPLGKDLIDSYLDYYINASVTARKTLFEEILTAAAGDERLGSASWTVLTVQRRLKNAWAARNAAA